MMNRIENAHQLRKEISRLKLELEKKELILKDSLLEVREDLKPENIAMKAISSATGINFAKGDFFKSGLMATISILLHRFITKQESVLEKKIFSWAESFIDKLRDLRSAEKE